MSDATLSTEEARALGKRVPGFDRAKYLLDKTSPPERGSEAWIAESWAERADAELERVAGEAEPLGRAEAELAKNCLTLALEERGSAVDLLWMKGLADELSRLRREDLGLAGWTEECLMGEVLSDVSDPEKEHVTSLTSPGLRGLLGKYVEEQKTLEREFLVWAFTDDGIRTSGNKGLALSFAADSLCEAAGSDEPSSFIARRTLLRRLVRDEDPDPGATLRDMAKDCRTAGDNLAALAGSLGEGVCSARDVEVLAWSLNEPDRVLSLFLGKDEELSLLNAMAESGLGPGGDGAEFKKRLVERIMSDPAKDSGVVEKIASEYRRAAECLEEVVLFAEEHARGERGLEFPPLRFVTPELPDMEFGEAADVKAPPRPSRPVSARASGMEL